MTRCFSVFLFFLLSLFLTGCESNQAIVNGIDERDANEIIVYLASKGIDAHKITAPNTNVGGGPSNLFSIAVDPTQVVDAMAILNRAGLPRKSGTTLLQLFAKSGLMSSTLEDTVRYQAGLAEELCNTIRKIDGVIDADVQISFPQVQAGGAVPLPGTVQPKITAAVYIKHQGIFEDPNSHLEIKIKRLMAGSVNGLSYDDVVVVSDRSKFADIVLPASAEMIGMKPLQSYTKIWGLTISQGSIGKFRFIFFALLILLLLLCIAVGWMVYRFYPQIGSLLKRKEKNTPPTEGP
jgi:type III secretion protein J